ncbi:hypothetical protein GW17_00032778 [Ensete ventricosum]|nr:hypothetical protein GW17_00032778 [Ensete ventricosum]
MGKVDMPQSQQAKHPPHYKDHGRNPQLIRAASENPRPERQLVSYRPAELDPRAPSTQPCSTSSPLETITGELAHTGQNHSAHSADTEAQTVPTRQTRRFSTNILALEGWPMSQERPSGNLNAEHRTEPNHPPQAKEVTTSGPTPNRFWRMMTGPGFPPPMSNPAPFVVTTEAFLDLTNQVQALAGMV